MELQLVLVEIRSVFADRDEGLPIDDRLRQLVSTEIGASEVGSALAKMCLVWPSGFDSPWLECLWSTLDVGSINGTHDIDGPIFQGGGRKANWPERLKLLRQIDEQQAHAILSWLNLVWEAQDEILLSDSERVDRAIRFWTAFAESRDKILGNSDLI